MKNCYPIQSCNHFMHRAFLLLTSLFLFLFVFTCGTQAYELNGTATGNILNNGYAAEADGFSVYADMENGYALTIEKENRTIVADADDANAINLCGEKVYYITIDGDNGKTILRMYDLNSGRVSDVYSVEVAKGIKNLFVKDDMAWFQSDGNVYRLDLNTNVAELVLYDVEAFLPLEDALLYTSVVNGEMGIYVCSLNEANAFGKLLASDVFFFDSDGVYAYYSNGEDGVYRIPVEGGKSEFLDNGGDNIVCVADQVYWHCGDEIVSWKHDDIEDNLTVSEDVTSFAVLSEEVATVSEEVGEGSVSPMAGMPAVGNDDSYKNWKQTDSRWADHRIGTKTIGDVGCAATSIAIMLVGSGSTAQRYMNNDFDPGIFVKEMKNNSPSGFDGNLIKWWVVAEIYPGISWLKDNNSFGNLNLVAQSVAVTKHRDQGNFIILGVRNNGHYVAADYGNGEDVFICDPGSSRITKLSEYGNASRAIIYSYEGNGWDGLLEKTSAPVITGVDTSGGTKVMITCRTANSKIYYTTDGTTPTTSSNLYEKPFVISSSATVKAIAVRSGYDDSDIASKAFVVWKNPYKDVSTSHWFYGSVAQASDYGLLFGYTDGTFKPEKDMTRAEFVCTLSRFLEIDSESYDHPFTDVGGASDKWFENAVAWAYSNGIVAGTSKTEFSPHDKITREQVCAIIVRFAKYLDTDLVSVRNYVTFVDQKNISNYAKDAIKIAYESKIISGSLDYGKLFMRPQNHTSRAEASTILVNFLNLL